MTYARLAHHMIISNNLLLLEAYWFGCSYTTGVIVTEDITTNEIKCYIDGVNPNSYEDEIGDAKNILHLGAHFPKEAAQALMPYLDLSTSWVKEHPEHFL